MASGGKSIFVIWIKKLQHFCYKKDHLERLKKLEQLWQK